MLRRDNTQLVAFVVSYFVWQPRQRAVMRGPRTKRGLDYTGVAAVSLLLVDEQYRSKAHGWDV